MIGRTCSLLGAVFGLTLLAGCTSYQGGPGYAGPPPLTPGFAGAPSSGRAVAILAPLTGPNAERGDALVKAARLALATPGAPMLDVRDTGGTPQGAAAAAAAALGAGDGLIIGPLTASETAAVVAPAQAAGVAVLSFTNDSAQARPGVWTLGLTPAQQVRRMVGAVVAQGKTRFAAVLPQSDFGTAMGNALTQAAAAAGAPPPDIHFHGDGNAAIAAAMRDVSGYTSRRGPLDARIRAAKAAHDTRLVADLSRQGVGPAPFDALLLADTGDRLAWLSTFLAYYDIDPPSIRLLGPAQWAAPAARSGASVNGAYYAAPDPAARSGFDQSYAAKYGTPAPGLADLAYDAAAIARVMAQGGGFSAGSLTRADGFAGVDGVLALQPDGGVRRGLALFQVQRDGAAMIEPAPETLSAPGI